MTNVEHELFFREYNSMPYAHQEHMRPPPYGGCAHLFASTSFCWRNGLKQYKQSGKEIFVTPCQLLDQFNINATSEFQNLLE